MSLKTILIELLLAGFFAVACIRAHGPFKQGKAIEIGDLFRLSDRIERLRRSRWQWFSMVLLMLIIRLQGQLPLTLEIMVALQFAVFLALPVQSRAKGRAPAIAGPGKRFLNRFANYRR
ncbi:MAG: hypothetical protein ACRD2U_12585 [Terriglobales bacterium]